MISEDLEGAGVLCEGVRGASVLCEGVRGAGVLCDGVMGDWVICESAADTVGGVEGVSVTNDDDSCAGVTRDGACVSCEKCEGESVVMATAGGERRRLVGMVTVRGEGVEVVTM